MKLFYEWVEQKGTNDLAALCFSAGGPKAECARDVRAVFCNRYSLNFFSFNSLVAGMISKHHQDGAL